MYMPSLVPRDIHHLWIQAGEKSKRKDARNSQTRNPLLEEQRRRPHFAPPLSAYSSERPGTNVYGQSGLQLDVHDPMFDVEVRMDALRSLRTLGNDYLAPIGVDRTQRAIDEEREMRRQMEEQHRTEAPTAENLMGEGEDEQFVQPNEGVESTGNNIVEEEETQREPQREAQRETQTTELDLDDDIPEAEENSYDHIYDEDDNHEEHNMMYEGDAAFERQYDEGFMVSEEYQEPEPIDGEPVALDTPRIEERYQRFMRNEYQTPNSTSTSNTQGNITNENGNSSFNRGNVSISSNFSHSNIQHDSFNDSTHPGDVSVNESDLDMIIDDE